MNAQEIINYIGTAEKKTPVKLYVKESAPVDWGSAKVFGAGDKIIFGEWKELKQEHPLSPGHWCSNCEINEKIHRQNVISFFLTIAFVAIYA